MQRALEWQRKYRQEWPGAQGRGYICQMRMINSPAQSIFVKVKSDGDSGLTVSALK